MTTLLILGLWKPNESEQLPKWLTAVESLLNCFHVILNQEKIFSENNFIASTDSIDIVDSAYVSEEKKFKVIFQKKFRDQVNALICNKHYEYNVMSHICTWQKNSWTSPAGYLQNGACNTF